jgi:GxxExxY protein
MNNELLDKIIAAAHEVHRQLGGPGLLETVYEAALSHELSLRGLVHQRQLPIPVIYKNKPIREPLFLDILVEDKIIVEIKANEKEYPYYRAQLSTHLRLMSIKHGLLINFGRENLKDGICQIINDHLCTI